MDSSNQKSPIVLLVTEGLNLSSSWQGNALLSAKPETFFDLWKGFPHTILGSTISPVDDITEFSSFCSGISSSSNKDYLNSIIDNKKFYSSPSAINVYDGVIKNKSALHFIGIISDNKKYNSDIKYLLSLLELAKQKKIFRVYVHLILDHSYEADSREMLLTINQLERSIEKIGIGEIASICGRSQIDDSSSLSKFTKAYQSIVSGIGYHALTAEQAITLKRGKIEKNEDRPPISITYQGKPVGKISDFDSIIMFNLETNNISRLILSLSQGESPVHGSLPPKCLTIATLFESIDQSFNKVIRIFDQDISISFSKLLSDNNINQYYISDSSRINHFNKYLLDNNQANNLECEFVTTDDVGDKYFDEYKNTLNQFFNKINLNISSNKYDFILIDIPAVYYSSNGHSFSLTIKLIKLIDNFIKKLYPIIFEKNGVLLLTSLNNSKQIGSKNSRYYTPFVFAMNDIKRQSTSNSTFQNQLMMNLLKKSYSVTDIFPTILDLFGIDLPSNINGKTLIDKKILY